MCSGYTLFPLAYHLSPIQCTVWWLMKIACTIFIGLQIRTGGGGHGWILADTFSLSAEISFSSPSNFAILWPPNFHLIVESSLAYTRLLHSNMGHVFFPFDDKWSQLVKYRGALRLYLWIATIHSHFRGEEKNFLIIFFKKRTFLKNFQFNRKNCFTSWYQLSFLNSLNPTPWDNYIFTFIL